MRFSTDNVADKHNILFRHDAAVELRCLSTISAGIELFLNPLSINNFSFMVTISKRLNFVRNYVYLLLSCNVRIVERIQRIGFI